jgi:hypothetical protein
MVLSTIRSRSAQALVVLCAVTLQWYVTRDYRSMARTRERADIDIDNPAWPATDSARRWAFREAGYDPVAVTNEGPPQPSPGRWTVTDGRGDVSVLSETDTRLRLTVHAQEPVRLVINSAFFPGWQVSVDGRIISPAILAGSGFMEVSVPAGRHDVEAVLGRTHVRAAAELITLISLIAWVVLAWSTARHWWRSHGPRSPDRCAAAGVPP